MVDLPLPDAEFLTGCGLVLEVSAAVVLASAQGSITKSENWGYANPRRDVLKKAEAKARWGWIVFGIGVGLQLVALFL